ncbi:MAG: tRNA (adenosine(37)-N6)-dimethylallyltransferase MiaA [Clostridia bacterium]|nr:tRNA (adenosine(37)-N6)-dimethylallyltransferase MiaA [Clostridia bacterium]
MVQKNSLAKVLVICGPTASGKTSLAVECAKLLESEVVSADSMCVYKGCDVGSAKPTEDEKQGVIHHMIDVVDPFSSYSVGDYKKAALSAINGIIQRGKIPVICGGTGFYINSVLFNLSYGNSAADGEIRAKYERFLASEGKEKLHAVLEEKDPETAEVLHVNDVKRVIRALEIYDVTGRKKSDISDDLTPVFDYSSYSVDFPREELYSRINSRVDAMMKNGLIDEVKGLIQTGVDGRCQCMQGIGYKEVYEGLAAGKSESEIAEEIKFNTRHYAKRQITFFKRDERLVLLKNSGVKSMAEYITGKFQ